MCYDFIQFETLPFFTGDLGVFGGDTEEDRASTPISFNLIKVIVIVEDLLSLLPTRSHSISRGFSCVYPFDGKEHLPLGGRSPDENVLLTKSLTPRTTRVSATAETYGSYIYKPYRRIRSQESFQNYPPYRLNSVRW